MQKLFGKVKPGIRGGKAGGVGEENHKACKTQNKIYDQHGPARLGPAFLQPVECQHIRKNEEGHRGEIVVNICAAWDKNPWEILCQKRQQHESRIDGPGTARQMERPGQVIAKITMAADKDDEDTDNAGEPGPPDGGIAEGENGKTLSGVGIVGHGIIHGAIDDWPFIPWRIEGMIHPQPGRGMIIQHPLLTVENRLKVVSDMRKMPVGKIRKIADQVDSGRHCDKEKNAPQGNLEKPLDYICFRILLILPHPDPVYPVSKV